MIVLDTDIKGLSWLQAARKINQIKPRQRILITTAGVAKQVENELAATQCGVEVDNILQKPFKLSELLSTIRPTVTDKLATAN
jgi:CheY-like chemotaxis protein